MQKQIRNVGNNNQDFSLVFVTWKEVQAGKRNAIQTEILTTHKQAEQLKKKQAKTKIDRRKD